jgi:hypothetical protein
VIRRSAVLPAMQPRSKNSSPPSAIRATAASQARRVPPAALAAPLVVRAVGHLNEGAASRQACYPPIEHIRFTAVVYRVVCVTYNLTSPSHLRPLRQCKEQYRLFKRVEFDQG